MGGTRLAAEHLVKETVHDVAVTAAEGTGEFRRRDMALPLLDVPGG